MSSIDSESPAETSIDEEAPRKSHSENQWGWRREHRIGIAIITLLILAAALIWYLRRPAGKNDPLVIIAGEKIELPVAIDPNTASAGSLSRIPGVGEKIAQAIVDYRDIHKPDFADGIVFRKLADVVSAGKIRNKKTIELCRTYMTFIDEPNPSPHALIPPKKLEDIEQTEDDE